VAGPVVWVAMRNGTPMTFDYSGEPSVGLKTIHTTYTKTWLWNSIGLFFHDAESFHLGLDLLWTRESKFLHFLSFWIPTSQPLAIINLLLAVYYYNHIFKNGYSKCLLVKIIFDRLKNAEINKKPLHLEAAHS